MKKSVLYSLHAFVLFTNFFIYFLILIKGHNLTNNISWINLTAYELGKIMGTYAHFILLFYLGYFLIANKFYKKSKYFAFLISIVAIIVVYKLIPYMHNNSLFSGNNWSKFSFENYFISLFITLFICFNGFLFRVFIDWFNNQQEKKELESEKLKTKLLVLLSQNNSHFIFNVLNNIDSMIVTKPAKASETICKLSELLRYIYSNTETDKVLLALEIEYIENYIDLQKLRLDSNINIHFEKKGISGNIKVIPMAFLPFIENAFKHGLINSEYPLNIKISFDQDKLYFECQNHFNKTTESAKIKSGFGISNITKRLALMYPSQYTLNINSNEELYRVSLTLQTDEN